LPWLTYSEDEVARFHPEFQSAADEALRRTKLDATLEWVHHVRTPGSSVIPDFVLRRRVNHQWLSAFELKRREEAVFSTRNQIQAKGYAETNQALYGPTSPRYFAISNLEITILSALNGDRPPRECQILNGTFESGRFRTDSREVHRERFINDLMQVIRIVTTEQRPQFDLVWPSVLDELITYSDALPVFTQINIPEPNTPNWPLVRDFFSSPLPVDSARVFFLRCLMAEYLRGILIKHGHPRASQIPAVQADQRSVANTIAALRQVDFSTLFEAFAPDLYRSIQDAALRDSLIRYTASLINPARRVVDLARDRVDAPSLVDSLMPTLYPGDTQDRSGKVQTDPELAAILARLTIDKPGAALDPCCGDGVLMSAAYDYLAEIRGADQGVLTAVSGVEADAVAARLAEIRLALKQPAILEPHPPITVIRGDLFANHQAVSPAEAILMNPPFLRYEEQQGRRVPPALRAHYNQSIRAIDGRAPFTTGGQANLYNYYVEFVLKAAAPGARLGIILDNKWYHNNYGRKLRELLLKQCSIEAIVEYPHWAFFSKWSIATSILVIRKVDALDPGHEVKFVRSKVDPRGADLRALADAFHRGGDWPTDWICRTRPQSDLNAQDGWKQYFSHDLENEFRLESWPGLDDLFRTSRRGSLEKEGAGIGVFEFPFDREDYGPRRLPRAGRTGFQTRRDRELTAEENERLRGLASRIPDDFRGWVLRNSYDPEHYELTPGDVWKQQIIEPPELRRDYEIFLEGRTDWTDAHERALASMEARPEVSSYIREVENVVNMTADVLPREMLWVALREPIAGELIIPRKTRSGHWVHVNPYVFDLSGRQVRISSNFITYTECVATDPESGLTREIATRLIGAFLVSSFGQLQFELEGYNREGCLSVEKHHLSKIRVFDPRWIRPENRQRILDAFTRLPYPVETSRLSGEQTDRNHLDQLIAEEITARFPQFDAQALLMEVHTVLDEWLIARQP
jgi:hypothetical protein